MPKIIIPVPGMVGVENKQARQAQHAKNASEFSALWRAVAGEFNSLNTGFRATGNARQRYMQITLGHSGIHYEWQVQQRQHILEVALHFECKDRETSKGWLNLITPHLDEINDGLEYQVEAVPFGKRRASARLQIPYDGVLPDVSIAPEAARQMKIFIGRTWPFVKDRVHGSQRPPAKPEA